MSRARGWCFTVNNYTEDDEKTLEGVECVYLVYGRERGAQDTPHLQGYIYFSNAKSLGGVKKILQRGHWERAKGNSEQNRDYCTKDGDFIERGERPMTQREKGDAGKRAYEEAFELAKQGRFEEIEEPLRTRFWSTYKRIRKDVQEVPPSVEELDNHWYWGDTGAGKTRKAREENPGAFLKNPNKWWDGYVDQECVLIDEWSPTHECLANHLKQWADHHPFAAETKGGMLCIRPKKIIITSNYHPSDCFPKREDLEPILRRFKITHFTLLNSSRSSCYFDLHAQIFYTFILYHVCAWDLHYSLCRWYECWIQPHNG